MVVHNFGVNENNGMEKSNTVFEKSKKPVKVTRDGKTFIQMREEGKKETYEQLAAKVPKIGDLVRIKSGTDKYNNKTGKVIRIGTMGNNYTVEVKNGTKLILFPADIEKLSTENFKVYKMNSDVRQYLDDYIDATGVPMENDNIVRRYASRLEEGDVDTLRVFNADNEMIEVKYGKSGLDKKEADKIATFLKPEGKAKEELDYQEDTEENTEFKDDKEFNQKGRNIVRNEITVVEKVLIDEINGFKEAMNSFGDGFMNPSFKAQLKERLISVLEIKL
jgi:hypothetical protein